MSPIGPQVPELPPEPLLSADVGGFAAALRRWSSEARIDEATAARARQRWLQQQAEEEATTAGVLCDLAERRVPVSIETTVGRRHRGRVAAVARDFAVVRLDGGREVLLALAGVASIRPEPGVEPPVGDRRVEVDLGLIDALAYVAGERPRVLVITRGGDHVAGVLRTIGQDLLSVALDGDARAVVFVPVDAVVEVGLV